MNKTVTDTDINKREGHMEKMQEIEEMRRKNVTVKEDNKLGNVKGKGRNRQRGSKHGVKNDEVVN